MSKLIAALVASTFAVAAFAQQSTPGTPPSIPPAGVAAKAAPAPEMAKPLTEKQQARKAKSTARKMKRAEKVGDKPLN